MDSSQGEKSGGVFGILESQATDSSAEHKIQINKIYGNGFDNLKKPTDLDIREIKREEKVDVVEDEVNIEVETKKEERFVVPKPLLSFLDTLIAKDLPLRTLKFDIEFARSNEEVAGFIQSYIDKSNILDEEDIDKLFSFVGYEKSSKSIETKGDNIEKQEEIQNTSLVESRIGYVEILTPYLEKIKKDKALYSKIMAELGGNEDMPLKDEPKELTLAREEYIKAKKENGIIGIYDELVEIEKLKTEILKSADSKLNSILDIAFASWDKYPNSILVADALGSDIRGLDKIVDADAFDGMRKESKVEVREVSPETSTVVVEDKKEPEIKFEIVGEGQKIEEEAKKIAETGEKLPVDNTVAEKPTLEQNSSPIEFEGKNLEIVRGQGEDKDSVHIVWGGVEIATGKIGSKGATVKIDNKFKSGFLFADTPEEKALKHVMPAIKILKS